MAFDDDLLDLERRALDAAAGDWLRAIEELKRLAALDAPTLAQAIRDLVPPSIDAAVEASIVEAYTLGASNARGIAELADLTEERATQVAVAAAGTPARDTLAPARGLGAAAREAYDKALALLNVDQSSALAMLYGNAAHTRRVIETQVNTAANEAAADVASAADLPVVWVAERNACVRCLAYSGRVVPRAGDSFPVGLTYGRPVANDRARSGPALHPHCRCHLEPLHDISYADALRREADRSVLRGYSLEGESMKTRLEAADRLVQGGVDAPKSVIQYAERAVKRGEFRTRDVPGGGPTLLDGPGGPTAGPQPPTPQPTPPPTPRTMATPVSALVNPTGPNVPRTDVLGGGDITRAQAAERMFGTGSPQHRKAIDLDRAAEKRAPAPRSLPAIEDDALDALQPPKTGWSKPAHQASMARLEATPEGKTLRKTLTTFQSGPASAIPRLRTDIEKYLEGDTTLKAGRVDTIENLLGAINSSDAGDRPLYRGMSIPGKTDTVLAKYAEGDTIDLSLASFSSDRAVASRFSRQGHGQRVSAKNTTPVVVEIVGQKNALPIQQVTDNANIAKEREWITAGKYRVVSAKKSSGSVVVKIEQVGLWNGPATRL